MQSQENGANESGNVLEMGSTKNQGLDARTGASPVPTIDGLTLLL